jgi:hypothetical protein
MERPKAEGCAVESIELMLINDQTGEVTAIWPGRIGPVDAETVCRLT